MGYIFACLVMFRLFFHFVLSDAWVYFYMRNYFAPSIYQNISPYAINNSDKNITTQLKLLFPNKVEQKLVLAYAHETQNILNAYVIQDGAIATEKRWFIWDCMRDAIKRENRLKYDPFIWNTIHNIEYTIVNTYKKHKQFNHYNVHHFDINKELKYLHLCKEPNEEKIDSFLKKLNSDIE